MLMDEYQENQYNRWNDQKKSIQQRDLVAKKIYFNQGDIWWCSIGKNIGTESCGKGDRFRRPVLILKKLSHEACIVLPLGTQEKKGTWFEEVIFENGKRWVSLYQIRMVHIKRFERKIGEITKEDMCRVKEKLGALLELSVNHHPTDVVEIEGDIPKNTVSIP
jgi:mRNA-degrading endonuclease toxin of MazEF toxin-antitoxin module